jgi:acetyltransferase-like isoleucine patch superfamily enzyme
MGAHSYGQPQIIAWHTPDGRRVSGRVVIGCYCSIAGGVTILTGGNHRTDFVSTYGFRVRWDLPGRDEDGQAYSKGDVLIGHDVWVGQNAAILSGVTVGHGAVVAAFSVVTKDVPPYAIVAGSPARIIRYRFSPDQIAALLGIAWWDWPESTVREAVPMLNGDDVQTFIDSYGGQRCGK